MTEIFRIGFESNDFSEFTAATTGTKLTTSAASAMVGNFGCNVNWNVADGDSARLALTGLGFDTTSGIVNLTFYLNVNTTTAGSDGDQGTLILLQDNTFADDFFNVYYERTAGVLHLIVETTVDGGANVSADSGVLAAGDLQVRLELIRASTAVSNDGILSIYINDTLKDQTFNIDNFNDYLGLTTGQFLISPQEGGAYSGATYLDEIVLYDNAIAAATDEFTAAPMKKPADIDSDGTNIYIGALNSLGFPVLIQFATALTTDGSVVFQPGSGNDIGCETARFDADTVYVAGNFGTPVVVEVSSDAGASFSDISPSGAGAVKSFAVGPDSDNRILIFEDTSNELSESIDGGTTWDVKNAAVSQSILSMARLGIDVNQVVFGNSSTDAETVTHSMSGGEGVAADLVELAGGPGQEDVDVNKVIIN